MRTAERRAADERILRRRLRTPKQVWILKDNRLTDADRARWQGIIRNTGTTCSCLACRYNRRHYGPSRQEKRSIAYLESELKNHG